MHMRRVAVVIILLLSFVFSQGNHTTEGGNITGVDLNTTQQTQRWAAIVGWLNGSAADITTFVSTQNVPNTSIYTNWPDGIYADYFNSTMILTRLDEKPEVSEISSPSSSDFNESGMFSNFTVFSGLNYSEFSDSPSATFCNPCTYTTCYVNNNPILCPYIILEQNFVMGILKFFNGTHTEPLFVGSILSRTGFNGTSFDFEYIVPVLENYYFYIYETEECEITVWIDGVPTTTFPKSAVPYNVRAQVLDNSSNPVGNVSLKAVEHNGRSIIYPILRIGKSMLGWSESETDSGGFTVFALSPTRYNIPDSYDYQVYLEVNDGGYYCRENLSISDYSSLSPTYRSSLVDSSYESQVKASIQNMNSLTSTASKWINSGKMREVNVTVYTNGTYGPLPTLKAGAPNKLNITVLDSTTLNPVIAASSMSESNGYVILVPSQPDKELYNGTSSYFTNETPVIIPTNYNNPAVLRSDISYGGSHMAVLTFTVDTVLEEPTAAEADMDSGTYSLISSALQNIISVLINMGKSMSTV